jgi:hypothetical protein
MHGKDTGRVFGAAVLLLAVASCNKSGGHAIAAGYSLIDDMEGAGGRIAWAPRGGWQPGQQPGFWTSSTDCTQAERIFPEPYFINPSGWSYVSVDPHPTMPGPPSQHAAHLGTKHGQPLQGVWGANIGFDFTESPNADGGAPWYPVAGIDAGSSGDGQACRQGSSRDFPGVPVDLRTYSGITFWAKASAYGRQGIRVQLNDVHTDPRGQECNRAGLTDERDCYNGFGKGFMLTSEFTQYRLDFAEAKQTPGWAPSPNGVLDVGRVYSLNFEVPLPGCTTDPNATCAGAPPLVSFDIWIDDIYFVNAP